MPPLSEKLETAIKQAESARRDPQKFARIKEFVSDVRNRGIVQPKDYDIPLIDTIGKATFRSSG